MWNQFGVLLRKEWWLAKRSKATLCIYFAPAVLVLLLLLCQTVRLKWRLWRRHATLTHRLLAQLAEAGEPLQIVRSNVPSLSRCTPAPGESCTTILVSAPIGLLGSLPRRLTRVSTVHCLRSRKL